MTSTLLLVAAFAPLVGSALALLAPRLRTAGRSVTAACAAGSIAAFALLLVVAGRSSGRIDPAPFADLRLDRASALLLVVVLATATVVADFSRRSLDDDRRVGRYFALIGLVASGSALLVLPSHPALLLAGWIGSGWALIALVGFEPDHPESRRAVRRTASTLAVGDVALMLAVLVAVANSDGLFTGDMASAVDQLERASLLGTDAATVSALLLVVAGASRSALVPFHRWLIGTLVAPTPVSALVHAGFVSGAGLLLIRLAPLFVVSTAAVVLAFTLAVTTVVVASAASLRRADVKGSLAWSTVAQMAFMVIQCAVGAFSSALVHIAGHGMYKAALFLGSGHTVSASLQTRRRPPALRRPTTGVRIVLTVLLSTLAVGSAVLVVPPEVSDAGRLLIVVFAFLSVAYGLDGWLQRGPLTPLAATVGGALAAGAGAFGYVGGIRLIESFVEPTLLSAETAIDVPVVVGTLIGIAVIIGLGARTNRLGPLVDRLTNLHTDPAPAGPARPTAGRRSDPAPWPTAVDHGERTDRLARIRSDVTRAAAICAPQWPLSSFVAVNPLGGLEALGFDEAAAEARRWLGARTHLTLDEYRTDHARGVTRLADLEYAVHSRCAELCAAEAIEVDGRTVEPVDVIVADLLHGPEAETEMLPRTALERCLGTGDLGRLIDEVVADGLTAYIASKTASDPDGDDVVRQSLRRAAADPRLRAHLDRGARAWLSGLGTDPARIIDVAFAVSRVAESDRLDELRGHCAQLPGWCGLAKWRNEWAPADEPIRPLAPIDVVALRAALEAAVIGAADLQPGPGVAASDQPSVPLAARVDAVARVIAPTGDETDHVAIGTVLSAVPSESRASMWLAAQERGFDERLLTMLDRLDPGSPDRRPASQAAFCIDVRSEGLRRHLEVGGEVETLGYAGFFGVPMSVQRLGWDRAEPRCPVLVSPAVRASEQPRSESVAAIARSLQTERLGAAVGSAHRQAKHGPGGPFALAEGLGWLVGPWAAWRTLRPGHTRPPAPRGTAVRFDDDVTVDQRVFLAESVLQTMGLLERFAPLVLLCGHTSRTINNPHATALECGACAGAAGDDNAQAVAALLNEPDVRQGLAERGIEVPDDTWFVAGLHDTTSDQVAILDPHAVPDTHREALQDLERALEQAGRSQAGERAAHLPGSARRVRDRGSDWAQVRPEWGLATNAAFIIGPRSMTTGLDLGGRTFLHSYDENADPSGRVLETIMTAPLVVGHWISSQYYFSTVEPEVLGAGNKLLHNPIDSVGVISGYGGDLRVGLPLQSTHMDGERHHQPVRLLAVIQAELSKIERVIEANQILRTLIGGSWLRISARSHPHERWSTRTPGGTWVADVRPLDPDQTLEPSTRTDMT